MAKKKSKGFIVPSINFITMHRPDQSGEVAPPVPKVNNPERERSEAKNPKKEKPVAEKQKERDALQIKPVALEKPGSKGRRKSALSLSSLRRNKQEAEEIRKKKERGGLWLINHLGNCHWKGITKNQVFYVQSRESRRL